MSYPFRDAEFGKELATDGELAAKRALSVIEKQVGAEKWDGPGLAVQWVEVEGPLHETWPPAGHRRLFGDMLRRIWALPVPAG